MIDDTALQEIIARAEAASSAPWRVAKNVDEAMQNWPLGTIRFGCDDSNDEWYVTTDRVRASEFRSDGPEADAQFIAAARTDVPALVAEVRRLQKLLAVCNDAHGHNVKLKAERDTLRDRNAKLEAVAEAAHAVMVGDFLATGSPTSLRVAFRELSDALRTAGYSPTEGGSNG